MAVLNRRNPLRLMGCACDHVSMPEPTDHADEKIPQSMVDKFLSQAMAYREVPTDEPDNEA